MKANKQGGGGGGEEEQEQESVLLDLILWVQKLIPTGTDLLSSRTVQYPARGGRWRHLCADPPRGPPFLFQVSLAPFTCLFYHMDFSISERMTQCNKFVSYPQINL